MHNELCSGSQCDFDHLNVTATGKIYTLYNASGDGRDLLINITTNATRSRLTFSSGGQIIFSGRNGSDITGSGTRGGHAGILNISVPDLLNTTYMRLIGQGAYTTASSGAGGNGGVIQIRYHGILWNFTDASNLEGAASNVPKIGAGNGSAGTSGSNGQLVYIRDRAKGKGRPTRDPDVDGDGKIGATDELRIRQRYGNRTGDSDFVSARDINDDGVINVLDLIRVGFEYNTR